MLYAIAWKSASHTEIKIKIFFKPREKGANFQVGWELEPVFKLFEKRNLLLKFLKYDISPHRFNSN